MKRIIYLILFCSLCIPIFRDSAFSAQTGAAFLKIGIGARPLGMGGGYIAIADDVNAIYWNPGGLAQLTKREISAMHNEWIDDLKYEFIAYATPITRIYPVRNECRINPCPTTGRRATTTEFSNGVDTNSSFVPTEPSGLRRMDKEDELARIKNLGTLAFGIAYLRMGEMEKRDEHRKLLSGTFTAYDMVLTFSYSRPLLTNSLPHLLTGINLKIIQQKIENETANGFAFDLGTLYRFPALPLTAGFAIQNLGPKMKFINEEYNLPLTISAGLAYKILGICNFGDPAKAVIGINVTYGIFEKRTEFGFGTEYWLLNTIALRGRYNISNSNELTTHRKCGVSDNNQLTNFGFGLGLKLTNYQFDYSFLPYTDLGNTHRLSFSAKF